MFDIVEFCQRYRKVEWLNQDNITFDCPWCGKGDKHFTVHVRKPLCNCWSCSKSGNWITVVSLLSGVSFNKAREKVNDGGLVFRPTKRVEQQPEKIVLPPKGSWSKDSTAYARARGLSDSVIDKYGVYFCSVGPCKNRIIFPVTLKGMPCSFQARAIYDWIFPRYMAPGGSKLGSLLYGYDQHPVCSDSTAYVVEGVFDYHALVNKGLNAFAVFKHRISSDQLIRLSELGVEDLVVQFDAGKEIESARACSLAYPRFRSVRCVPMVSGDPGSDGITGDPVEDFHEVNRFKILNYVNKKR